MRNSYMARCLILALVLLILTGCGAEPVQPVATEAETVAIAITEPVTEPEQTEAAETICESEPPVEEICDGMIFSAGDVTFQVGGPVSDLMVDGVELGMDPDTRIPAGQISGNIRVKVSDGIYFYFHAINDAQEPEVLAQCRIYSVTVNVQEGIRFGMEGGDTFTNGISTVDQIIGEYGTPDHRRSNSEPYEEIAYYAPFESVYCSFKEGIVRQVMAVYWQPGQALTGDVVPERWNENDALLLMGKYMDVSPYLAQEENPDYKEKAELGDTVTLGDGEIQLGSTFFDLPEEFISPYRSAPLVLDPGYYILTGKGNGEEFFLLNRTKKELNSFDKTTVIGIVTHNAGYTNWGSDYGNFHTFHYQGLEQNSTIEDILAIFGMPRELHPSSGVNGCFLWMHYIDADGDQLRIRVDPMTDQIVELRIRKYYPDANMYQ